ncbi:MAG TPA: hypothetical protein VG815_19320 [Chloroflexota bacterium]|jgi:hypothetical protein|nr:hypothetical protein [Chloroflexota bacterium]
MVLLGLPGCSGFWQSSGPAPGTIIFGTGIHRVSAHQIDIVGERTTFHLRQSVAWVAYLRHPAGATTLTLSILSPSNSSPVITPQTITRVDPKWTQLANPGEPERGLRVLGVPLPGRYIFRYSRGSVVLAEGTVNLKG